MRRFLPFAFALMTVVAGIVFMSINVRGQQPRTQPGVNAPPGRGGVANNEAVSGPNAPFVTHCASCHGGGQVPNAPDVSVLRQMTPEQIYKAITTGPMQGMAQDLTDAAKISIAESLSGRRLRATDTTSAEAMQNRCPSNPPLRDPQSGAFWNGWSPSLGNTRLQPANMAMLSPGQVSRLKLLWAFGVPGATSLYNEPTIVGGRIYFSSDTGQVYSIDAVTGCAYWSFQAQAGVRSAITIATSKEGAQRQLAYFGDIRGNVYAVDAAEGELMWKAKPESHPMARITAAPKLYKDRLYVPIASLEEVEGSNPLYPCCSTRGAVAALDAATGKVIWKTYTIPDIPTVTGKNSRGTDVMGPSGAGVWNSPTIDPKRNALYVGTGNGFTEPATKFSDAIIAMDLDTGRVLWSFQAHPHGVQDDIWHGGCQQAVPGRNPNAGGSAGRGYPPESCPEKGSPDWDFSASPILATLADGRNLLVAGQKSGVVWAFDVDKKGALVWSQDVARVLPGGGGEIVFGGAADDHNAYFNLRSGGMVALDLATGMEKWFTPFGSAAPAPFAAEAAPVGNTAVPNGGSAQAQGQEAGQQMRAPAPPSLPIVASAAVTLIPGVVLSSGVDGFVRAFSSSNGGLLWQYDTTQEFKTVNGVPAKGGAIGSAGPIVVDGRVYVVSGYLGFQHGAPGNALLAFGTGE